MKVEFLGELGSELLPAVSVVNAQKSPCTCVRLNWALSLPTDSVRIKRKHVKILSVIV